MTVFTVPVSFFRDVFTSEPIFLLQVLKPLFVAARHCSYTPPHHEHVQGATLCMPFRKGSKPPFRPVGRTTPGRAVMVVDARARKALVDRPMKVRSPFDSLTFCRVRLRGRFFCHGAQAFAFPICGAPA
jgi:hypothetical protein